MKPFAQSKFLVRPDGQSAVWLHPLDQSTGHYPQYDDWIDATELDDEEFEALILRLQGDDHVPNDTTSSGAPGSASESRA